MEEPDYQKTYWRELAAIAQQGREDGGRNGSMDQKFNLLAISDIRTSSSVVCLLFYISRARNGNRTHKLFASSSEADHKATELPHTRNILTVYFPNSENGKPIIKSCLNDSSVFLLSHWELTSKY